MATTTNYSWTTPDDTALVKDGAAAIRSLGTAIDTTVFTNAGAAIPKTLIDAKGDLIVGSAADTAARLASSASNGNVLTVDTSTATGLKWSAPAGGGKVLQVVSSKFTNSIAQTFTTTSYVDTSFLLSITPTSATSKILILMNFDGGTYVPTGGGAIYLKGQILRGATSVYECPSLIYAKTGENNPPQPREFYHTFAMMYLDDPATTSATTYKLQGTISSASSGGGQNYGYFFNLGNSSITLMEIGA